MITVKKMISLQEFDAWSGAKDRLDKIIDLDIVEQATEHILMTLGDEIDETELNDFLWFGIDDFIEQYEMGDNDND